MSIIDKFVRRVQLHNMQQLLEAGAEPEVVALHYARDSGDEELNSRLNLRGYNLAHAGVDKLWGESNSEEETLEWAAQFGHLGFFEALIEAGAKGNLRQIRLAASLTDNDNIVDFIDTMVATKH